MSKEKLEMTALKIRRLILEAIRPKETHHIGCAFSITDILTYLYFDELKINCLKPSDPKRDIFLLSKGHAALALYSVLCEKGFFSKRRLLTFDQDGSDIPEHASTHVEGVEFSTGSLGHALPVGIGFATSFLNDKKKNKVYVLLSDGEMNEGSNWEAIMYAGSHKINNLIAVVDKNGFQGYSATEKVIDLSPLKEKLEAFGWEVLEADGHDFEDLKIVFGQKQSFKKPKIIIANTIKGKGIPYFEGRFDSHYKSIDEDTKSKIIKEFLNKK